MTVHVFIDGAAGTTGLEIRERLADRADLAVLVLDERLRKDVDARREALNDADIAVLCLPDDAAREAVALIANGHTKVIDASTAYRVADSWTYGFAELMRGQADAISRATRVSNPGCYPTAFLALVRPLIDAGLIPTDWLLSVNAASGYSGGGKAMIADFEGGDEDGGEGGGEDTGLRAYALDLAHKHLPEMQRHAGLTHPPIFAPSVARTYRGMMVEVPLHLHALPRRPTIAAIRSALAEAYQGCALIEVGPDATMVRIEEHAGTDRMTLRVQGNEVTGQARLIATLDNLGKGASGAAVQNLNLMAGLDPLANLVL